MSSIAVNRNEFNEVMQTASAFAGLHKGLLMLDNVLFQIKDKNLLITSTDTEAYVSRSVRIDTNEDATDISFLVNPKDICQLLSQITDETVTIEFEDNAMTLKYSNGYVSTATYDGSEFPVSPFEGGGNVYTGISADTLAEAMKKAVNFASNDITRPAMCSVVLHFDEVDVSVYASDAVAMFSQRIHDSMGYDNRVLLIPKKSIKAIVNLLKTCAVFRGIVANDTHIKFVFDDGVVISCLTDAKYPNVKRVLPQSFSKTIHVGKMMLMDSIKRVSLSAGDRRRIRFDLKSGYKQFDISSADADLRKESKESIHADINADTDIEIGFNADNVIKAVSSLKGNNITLQMNQSCSATMWSSDEDDATRILVMPIHIDC